MKLHENRFKSALKERGFTIESFGKTLGKALKKSPLTRQGVYHLMKRNTLKEDTLSEICNILQVDRSEILETENKGSVNETSNPKGNITFVPLKAYGGFLTGYANKVYVDSLEHFNLPGIYGRLFCFEAEGMSMFKEGHEDSIKPEDRIYCEQIENFAWMRKGKMYVLVTVDGILIKYFDGFDGTKAKFKSLNPDYDGFSIALKEIKVVFLKTWIMKKG